MVKRNFGKNGQLLHSCISLIPGTSQDASMLLFKELVPALHLKVQHSTEHLWGEQSWLQCHSITGLREVAKHWCDQCMGK